MSKPSPGAAGPGATRRLGRARLYDPRPHVLRLSNGRYSVRITNAGGGGSEGAGIAVTRWRADAVEDGDGVFVYLRDLDTGRFWSLGHQPTAGEPERYEVVFAPDRAVFARTEAGITATMVVTLAGDDAGEIRTCTLDNGSPRSRRIELTTYLEPVLLAADADAAHPAFAKLFVETEVVPDRRALLATRRARGADEHRRWAIHWLIGDVAAGTDWSFETDRLRFVGRGRDLAAPAALAQTPPLSGTTGAVLDPVLCLRTVVELAPGARRTVGFGLGLADSRDDALALTTRHAELEDAARDLAGWSDAADETAAERGASAMPPRRHRPLAEAGVPVPERPEELRFDNGCGGFAADGRDYVLRIRPSTRPPLPWTHILANEDFGVIVSESGARTSWAGNSRENRLTPWFNDPVVDPHGEALYLRDEDAGTFWSPMPGPVPSGAACTVRYGFGYASFQQTCAEMEQAVEIFVPRHDPLQVTRIRLCNLGDRPRRIGVFTWSRLVLGVLPNDAAVSVETWFDRESGALLARNPDRGVFSDRVAFAKAVAPAGAAVHHTADRTAFVGRNGAPARPAALATARVLDGRTGAGLEPCLALQVLLELAPGETKELAFLLGEGPDEAGSRSLLQAYTTLAAVDRALGEVTGFWRDLVSAVQIRTPMPALDLMANGWLAHQTLCCRLWARSAFYQSGGAFGFRDQLQDAAALLPLRPDLTRAQILLHAAHQFAEGDVLHWWHPPEGRGIRTRFSDDLLWLPLITADYVAATGDRGLLDEQVRFLEARPLAEGEDEAFLLATDSDTRGSVYEHCCRALDRSLGVGAHGLPLMGTGDWNDGMNRVGREGRGESVWLGFFLHLVLGRFVPLCRERGDHARATRYEAHRAKLAHALNEAGWDGAWYRRAYYDDGTPLGAAEGDECRIDALAQAWAVISGVAPPERVEQCLDALEAHLIDETAGLIRLLTPPFDRTGHDPGYIKGYLPGVRENGGQYTHAALWVVQAFAEGGRIARAAELLTMLSPVGHARTPAEVATYQVEPYVVVADVCGAPPHVGRGGWTWYTGSAGWMLRVILETLLGFAVEGGATMVLKPRVPTGWPGCELRWRVPGDDATYVVTMATPTAATSTGATVVVRATLDGRPIEIRDGAARVPVLRDGSQHRVRLELG